MQREKFIMPPIEKPKLSETQERLEKLFELKKQYQEQVKALLETQVIEILPESSEKAGKGVLGVYDINGKECPIPSYNEILARMSSDPEKVKILEKKREQGFTELLLVPIGTPLSFLIDRTRDLIVKKHKQGKLLGTDGEKLELDENQPVYVDDGYQDADVTGNLVYYPQKFDKANHGGKTKQELLEEWPASRSFSVGWEIQLIEDLPDLPKKGKGKIIAGREQFEANQIPEQCLEKIQTDPQYANEQFTTLEAMLCYFMQNLYKHDQVIADSNGRSQASWNGGTYSKIKSGVISLSYWLRRQHRFELGWGVPGIPMGDSVARAAVRI